MSFLKRWKKERDFQRLYEEQNEFIRAALYWVGPYEIKDELVQDTFLKAWNSWDRFQGDSSMKTWLYRIAMNCAKDALRKKNFHESFDEEKGEGSTAVLPENADLENREEFLFLLNKLSFEHREVLVLTYYLGHTIKEIADLTKRPEGTIKSQLHYAKKFFEEEMKNNEEVAI